MNNVSELGESFRQSRKEMWVILAAWTFFLLWTGIACTVLPPGEVGEEVVIPTLFGIPQWVALGVILPWLGALVFIFWFALRFMKDTNLGEMDSAEIEESDS